MEVAAVRGADTEVAAAVVETLMAAARDVEVIQFFESFLLVQPEITVFVLLICSIAAYNQ